MHSLFPRRHAVLGAEKRMLCFAGTEAAPAPKAPELSEQEKAAVKAQVKLDVPRLNAAVKEQAAAESAKTDDQVLQVQRELVIMSWQRARSAWPKMDAKARQMWIEYGNQVLQEMRAPFVFNTDETGSPAFEMRSLSEGPVQTPSPATQEVTKEQAAAVAALPKNFPLLEAMYVPPSRTPAKKPNVVAPAAPQEFVPVDTLRKRTDTAYAAFASATPDAKLALWQAAEQAVYAEQDALDVQLSADREKRKEFLDTCVTEIVRVKAVFLERKTEEVRKQLPTKAPFDNANGATGQEYCKLMDAFVATAQEELTLFHTDNARRALNPDYMRQRSALVQSQILAASYNAAQVRRLGALAEKKKNPDSPEAAERMATAVQTQQGLEKRMNDAGFEMKWDLLVQAAGLAAQKTNALDALLDNAKDTPTILATWPKYRAACLEEIAVCTELLRDPSRKLSFNPRARIEYLERRLVTTEQWIEKKKKSTPSSSQDRQAETIGRTPVSAERITLDVWQKEAKRLQADSAALTLQQNAETTSFGAATTAERLLDAFQQELRHYEKYPSGTLPNEYRLRQTLIREQWNGLIGRYAGGRYGFERSNYKSAFPDLTDVVDDNGNKTGEKERKGEYGRRKEEFDRKLPLVALRVNADYATFLADLIEKNQRQQMFLIKYGDYLTPANTGVSPFEAKAELKRLQDELVQLKAEYETISTEGAKTPLPPFPDDGLTVNPDVAKYPSALPPLSNGATAKKVLPSRPTAPVAPPQQELPQKPDVSPSPSQDGVQSAAAAKPVEKPAQKEPSLEERKVATDKTYADVQTLKLSGRWVDDRGKAEKKYYADALQAAMTEKRALELSGDQDGRLKIVSGYVEQLQADAALFTALDLKDVSDAARKKFDARGGVPKDNLQKLVEANMAEKLHIQANLSAFQTYERGVRSSDGNPFDWTKRIADLNKAITIGQDDLKNA